MNKICFLCISKMDRLLLKQLIALEHDLELVYEKLMEVHVVNRELKSQIQQLYEVFQSKYDSDQEE